MSTRASNKRQRTGIWNSSNDTAEQKRARNRQSQRSFRERRMIRIQELESRVKFLSMGGDERNAKLVEENNRMRVAYVRARQQALNLEMMLKNLQETMNAFAEIADGPTGCAVDAEDVPGTADGSGQSSTFKQSEPAGPNPSSPASCHRAGTASTSNSDNEPADNDYTFLDSLTGLESSVIHLPAQSPSYTELWTATEMMGQEHMVDPNETTEDLWPAIKYSDACIGSTNLSGLSMFWNATPSDITNIDINLPNGAPVFSPNAIIPIQELSMSFPHFSRISASLNVMEELLITHVQSLGTRASDSLVMKACLALMVCFCRYVFPGPPEMFFASFCYGLGESVAYRRLGFNKQSRRTPSYMIPTELQQKKKHPPMIAWISIPQLRERILHQYSSDLEFDQIWMDVMISAVVEVEDVSTILTGVGSGRGFLSIWSIFEILHASRREDDHTLTSNSISDNLLSVPEVEVSGLLPVYRMPLPDGWTGGGVVGGSTRKRGEWTPVSLEELCASPDLARKLYYHLELYDSHKVWKTDPAVFTKYPKLHWAGREEFTAKGVAVRFPFPAMPTPGRYTSEQVLHIYKQALLNLSAP